MEFIGYMLVIFITLVLTVLGASQIMCSIVFRIFRGQIKFLITIIIWALILYSYYYLIAHCFEKYFTCYLYTTIIASILCLFFLQDE